MSTSSQRPMLKAMLFAERDVAQAEADLLEARDRRDEHKRTVDTLRQILDLIEEKTEGTNEPRTDGAIEAE